MASLKDFVEKAEDTPESVTSAVDSAAQKIEELEQKLARTSPQRWPRTLYSRITRLNSAIDGYTEAPGPKHKQNLDALSKELTDLLESLNKFIDEEIPNVNRTIQQSNMPRIIPRQRVELPS